MFFNSLFIPLLNLFDAPLIKLAFLLINTAVRAIDVLLLAFTRFSIGMAAGINLLRSYLHGDMLKMLMANAFQALGMTSTSLNGFFLLVIVLAVALLGLYKIYTIFSPTSRPWINVENLIRNTMLAVVLVLSGFTVLQQIEEVRIELSESVAASLLTSVSTFPPNNPNFDYPAICYQGHGTPCMPELDCARGVGCINKSTADKVGGLIGIKDQKEIFVTDLPPDFQAAYNLRDISFPTSFNALPNIFQKWLESISLAAISTGFSIPIILESLSVLMLDLTALVLFLTLPLAIAFSFFSITEGFFLQLIQKYISLFIMSLVLFTVIPLFIEISFRVGGYIALGLTAPLLWGAALFIVYRPLMDSMLFTIDGTFQAAGVGGFSQTMKDVAGLAGEALTFGIGVATGGASLGLSAISGMSGVKNNATLNSTVNTAKSVSGMISGAALSQSSFGKGIVSAAAMMSNDKDRIGLAPALRHASIADSMAAGMAAVQNKGVLGLLYARDRLKRGAEANMLDKVYDGDPVAVQDNALLEYRRLKKSAAKGNVEAQNKLNRMMGDRVNDSGDVDISSEKYLQPVGRGVAEIKAKTSAISQQDIVSTSLANGVELANDGKIKFINSTKVAEEAGKMATVTVEEQRKIGDNITSVLGSNGGRAAMVLSRQVMPNRVPNENPITALDIVQDAYQDALVQLKKSAPDGNILPLLRDGETGALTEKSPLMVAFNQALDDRGAGKIMTNAALRNSAVEYLNAVTRVQAQLPGVAMVSTIRNAVERGMSPVASLQATYGVSPEEVTGGFGTIVSHLAQNPEGEMAPIMNAIAANPRQKALQSFTEKMQEYIRAEVAKGDSGDRNVLALVSKSKTGFKHVQASRAVVTDMVKKGLIDKEEWDSFRETYRSAAESMGMERDNETMLWRTVEALRTIPASVSVMVNPLSPLAMQSGGYVISQSPEDGGSGSSVAGNASTMSSNIPQPPMPFGVTMDDTGNRNRWEGANAETEQSARTDWMNSLVTEFEVLNEVLVTKQAEYVALVGQNPPELNIPFQPSTPEQLEQLNNLYKKYLSDLDASMSSIKGALDNKKKNDDILGHDDIFFID